MKLPPKKRLPKLIASRSGVRTGFCFCFLFCWRLEQKVFLLTVIQSSKQSLTDVGIWVLLIFPSQVDKFSWNLSGPHHVQRRLVELSSSRWHLFLSTYLDMHIWSCQVLIKFPYRFQPPVLNLLVPSTSCWEMVKMKYIIRYGMDHLYNYEARNICFILKGQGKCHYYYTNKWTYIPQLWCSVHFHSKLCQSK